LFGTTSPCDSTGGECRRKAGTKATFKITEDHMGADRPGADAGCLAGATARARTENTAAGQKALRAALMAKASALVPLLRAKAADTERERCIADDVLAAIDAAQLFRLRTPQRFGGFEGDLRTYMDVVTELGRGCGSTSWVAFISIATV
jgi:alkylation response protein AidB-like acyl-CoA dehydrogenase